MVAPALAWFPWGAAYALGGLLAGGLLAGLVAGVAEAIFGKHSAAVELAQFVGLWTGVMLAAVLAVRSSGSGSVRHDLGLRFRWPRDLIGIPVGAACQFLVVPGVIAVFSLFGKVRSQQQTDALLGGSKGIGLALVVLAVAIGAPVAEELLYRGLLLRGGIRLLGLVGSAAFSSVAFGVSHYSASYTGMTAIALMTALCVVGCVLATLAVRTGRLGPGIVTHMTFNVIAAVSFLLTR
jgi:membrane protease YdiL (CAAX protease family)